MQEGYENGNAFYGTQGMMILGKEAAGSLYGPRNKELRTDDRRRPTCRPTTATSSTASATATGPNADIEIGHLSASLCHLGNIAAASAGRCTSTRKGTIVGDDEANGLIRRNYRAGGHWAIPKAV